MASNIYCTCAPRQHTSFSREWEEDPRASGGISLGLFARMSACSRAPVAGQAGQEPATERFWNSRASCSSFTLPQGPSGFSTAFEFLRSPGEGGVVPEESKGTNAAPSVSEEQRKGSLQGTEQQRLLQFLQIKYSYIKDTAVKTWRKKKGETLKQSSTSGVKWI